MWVIGEFLTSVIADLFSFAAEVIVAAFSDKQQPPAQQGAQPGARQGAPQGLRAGFAGRRAARENARGAAFERRGAHVRDIIFSRGELAGRRASELTTRRLRVLADSWPDRAVRLGIRSYLNANRPGWRAAAAKDGGQA
jgi:hypothetical protein